MNIYLERLKDELSYRGLTQKELAEKADISVNTIRGWFSKNLSPDIFSCVKIANALNVTVEYLTTGKTENLPQDINKAVIKLTELNETQRKPIIDLIISQVDYWKQIYIK